MSIVSFHAHFHIDREGLRQLADWFIGVGRMTSAATTIDGAYKKTQRHYHKSTKMLAAFTAALNEEQREELHTAVTAVAEAQANLQTTPNVTRAGKKELLVEYEVAEKMLNTYIKLTSDAIMGEVSTLGTRAPAYKLYEACGHKGIDPQQMVKNIQAAIKGKEETPRDQRKKQSKRQDNGKSGRNRQLADQLMTYMAKNIMEELDEADD